MKKTTLLYALLAGGVLLGASEARAQVAAPATEKYFVNVNFGGQFADRTITTQVGQTVYEEQASLISDLPVGGGFLFDVTGGYRVWGDIYVALQISRAGDSDTASFSASIPHPLFFNQPRTVEGQVEDLGRSEVGFHPQIIWVYPATDKFDVALSFGPSFIRLKQDLLNSFSVPAQTQDVNVAVEEESGTGVGVNIGADLIYNLQPRYGVGVFIRYAGASVDLDAIDDVKVGGFQMGGGIRLRF